MKIVNLLKELEEKDFFKKFMEENNDAYFGACFAVIGDEEKCQLDYFIPSKEKMASASYPFSEMKLHEDKIKQCKKLGEIKIDISDIWDKVEEIKKEKQVKNTNSKIIAILKDDLWNLSVLSTSMDILRIKLDAITGEVKEFKKGSMFEFIKKLD